jgi:periplasmic protein TonB
LIGALGIPVAVGALLVVGLAVKVVIAPEDPGLKGFTLKPVPISPPPPDPVDPATPTTQQPSSTIAPVSRPDTIPLDFGTSDPIMTLPGVGELTGPIAGPVDFGIPAPTPSASPYAPVAASPRGNPGRWVTNSDYRPRWIREELTGSASFTLNIDAGGKVRGCTITRSTGHSVLDQATCDLVSSRARFDAARDGSGKPVAGSYSGSITWKIPD